MLIACDVLICSLTGYINPFIIITFPLSYFSIPHNLSHRFQQHLRRKIKLSLTFQTIKMIVSLHHMSVSKVSQRTTNNQQRHLKMSLISARYLLQDFHLVKIQFCQQLNLDKQYLTYCNTLHQ